MNDLRVEMKMEVKVCEGCGALWLRSMELGVYCNGCARQLSEFPAVRKSRRGRKRKAGNKASVARANVCAGGAK